MGAGEGLTPVEAFAACHAMIAASEDPKSGRGKKSHVIEQQVRYAFQNLTEQNKSRYRHLAFHERTGDAIIQRYKKARASCIKFESIVLLMKSKRPTGSPTLSEFERAALAVYNGEATIPNMYTFFNDQSVRLRPRFSFMSSL